MAPSWKEKSEAAKEMGLYQIGDDFFRIKEDGEMEEMIMFDPIFGWLSRDDLFDLRQTDPRIAP